MALATKWRPLPRLLLASSAVPAGGTRASGDWPAPLVRVYRHAERRGFSADSSASDSFSASVSHSDLSSAAASLSTTDSASAAAVAPGTPTRSRPSRRSSRTSTSPTPLKQSLMHQDLLALAPVSKDQSVVVKPIIEYPNYSSMRKSIQHHRRSVNTQIYLETEREKHRRPSAASADSSRSPGFDSRSRLAAPASPPPDWRAVIATLVAATPERAPWKGAVVHIAVSQPIYEELTAGVDSCIWEIYTRTGCTLDVYAQPSISLGPPGSATLPGGAYVVLSGDSNAIKLAVAELRTLAQSLTTSTAAAAATTTAAAADNIGPALRVLAPDEAQHVKLDVHGRHTTAFGEKPRTIPTLQGRQLITGRLDHEIARPAVWTQTSLVQYIGALAHAHLSHQRTLTLYNTPRERDEVRLKLMMDALMAEDARAAVSLAAFKRAMYSAMLAGPAMRPYMRLFLAQMVRVGLVPDTDVFNMFLEEAAKQKDLRKFRSVLKMMLDHGCVPNLLSWMHMLRTVEHEVAKRHVVRVMHERGLLYDSRALRMVAHEMVFFDAHRAMMGSLSYEDDGAESQSVSQSVPQSADPFPPSPAPPSADPSTTVPIPFSVPNFTTHLSKLYGPAWMSTTTVRQIVDVFCAFTNWDAIFAFLDTVPPRFKQDPVLYNTILSRARTVKQWDPVMPTLAAMHAVGLAPDEIAYTQLLRLARSLKWPNTTAAVWLYAAAADRTTFNMRATVGFDLSHPGTAMDRSYHAVHPRARFVAPAYMPMEYASALGSPRLEMHEAADGGPPSVNRFWPAAADGSSDQSLAKRKLGAVLLQVLRLHIRDRGLRPLKSLAEALAEARAWDQKLVMSDNLAHIHVPAADGSAEAWPMMEVPLCLKDTQEPVETLHLPVTRYLIRRKTTV